MNQNKYLKPLVYIHFLIVFILTQSLGIIALLWIDQLWVIFHKKNKSLIDCLIESDESWVKHNKWQYMIEYLGVLAIIVISIQDQIQLAQFIAGGLIGMIGLECLNYIIKGKEPRKIKVRVRSRYDLK